MVVVENDIMSKIHYLLYFVTRAFLIAILCLLFLICIFCAIYFGDLFLNVKTGNYKSPLFNGYIIVSESMVPTIRVNDAIVVKRESHDKYEVGDIISFFSTEYQEEGMIVTHRIVDKSFIDSAYSSYRTKGDNNPIPDREAIHTDSIYGKVVFIIPQLGKIQSIVSQPKYFILCLFLPAGVVIGYNLFKLRKVLFLSS